jgi:flagellar biosynthetic protein FliQ
MSGDGGGDEMSMGYAFDLCRDALVLILILSGPALVASLGIGLLISIFQSATQIHDYTITFVPKIVVTLLTLLLLGSWLLSQLVLFTQRLYQSIATVIGT